MNRVGPLRPSLPYVANERKESVEMSKNPAEVFYQNWVVRKKDLARYTGLQRTAIDTLIRRGKFPRPMALTDGGRAKGWLLREILEWQRERLAMRDEETSK